MQPATFGSLELSWLDVLARIGATILFSLALGLERFLRKKPIDFRPFAIIGLASCTLVLGVADTV